MANIAAGLTDIGGAVSDLFGAKGARAAAGSYEEAKRIAEENAAIAAQATKIKLTMEDRQIFRTIGAQEAQVGGAGFAASGSALDLLRSSASQGALTKAITVEQGKITENSYRAQAQQFGGMAEAAKASTIGQGLAGLLNLGAAGFNLSGGGAAAAGATAVGEEAIITDAIDLAAFA
jgi:hypothetical protein